MVQDLVGEVSEAPDGKAEDEELESQANGLRPAELCFLLEV